MLVDEKYKVQKKSSFQFIYSGIKYSNIYYHIIVLPFVVKVVSKLTTHKDKNYFVIDNNLLSNIVQPKS